MYRSYFGSSYPVVHTSADSIVVKTSSPQVFCGRALGSHEADFAQNTNITLAHSGDDKSIRHALRVRARKLLMSQVKLNRFDAEGIDQVDLDIPSHKQWKTFLKTLTPDHLTTLTVWRSGAVWTPTRRFWRPNAPNAHTSCFWCPSPVASARHFFCDCPKFEAFRFQLQQEFQIPPEWWSQQPRCTAKTGRITFQAHPCLDTRTQSAIAANRLGIHIATCVFEHKSALGL